MYRTVLCCVLTGNAQPIAVGSERGSVHSIDCILVVFTPQPYYIGLKQEGDMAACCFVPGTGLCMVRLCSYPVSYRPFRC